MPQPYFKTRVQQEAFHAAITVKWQFRGAPVREIHGFFTGARHIAPSFRYSPSQSHPNSYQGDTMEDRKNQFRIELTPEQKDQVRHATGKDAEAVELSVEELEERIAPAKMKLR
jgi:hypothetical protein